MNAILKLLLVTLAVGILVWEFERYRTRFVKADLLTGIGFATGLLIMAVVPGIYDRIGTVFDIRQRTPHSGDTYHSRTVTERRNQKPQVRLRTGWLRTWTR